MTDTDITLDGSTANWPMPNTKGDYGGTYTGTFTFRCFLTPTQLLAASKKYRELLGPNAIFAPEHEGHVAYALTQLEHRILKSPPFWTQPLQNGEMAGNIPDLNIILMVLDAASRAQALYIEKMNSDRTIILKRTIDLAEEMLVENQKEEK